MKAYHAPEVPNAPNPLRTEWECYAATSLQKPEWLLVKGVLEPIEVCRKYAWELLARYQSLDGRSDGLGSRVREMHQELITRMDVRAHYAYALLAFTIHTSAFVFQEKFGDHDGGQYPRLVSPDAVIGDRHLFGKLKKLVKTVPGILWQDVSEIAGIVGDFFISDPCRSTSQLRDALDVLEMRCTLLDDSPIEISGVEKLFEFEEVAKQWLISLERIYPDRPPLPPIPDISIRRVRVEPRNPAMPLTPEQVLFVELARNPFYYFGRPQLIDPSWCFARVDTSSAG